MVCINKQSCKILKIWQKMKWIIGKYNNFSQKKHSNRGKFRLNYKSHDNTIKIVWTMKS